MSVIKQISVYDGSNWGTEDIGADAGNILLSSNIAGSTNLQTALGNILPASQLTANQVLIADSNKKLATSGISATQLGYLDGVTSGIQTQINTLSSNLTSLTTTVDGKAPTSHASSATTYGVGTTANYGHCKTINNLTTSSYSNGQALSAYQGYLLNQNKIGSVSSYLTIAYFSFGALTANDSGAIESTKSVASVIPSGYTMKGVIPAQTGSYAFYFYSCIPSGTNSVKIMLKRASGSTTSTTPAVYVICAK